MCRPDRAPFRPGRGVGVLAARICTPGAVASGLIQPPAGPRDENAAIMSPAAVVFVLSVNVAVAVGCAARNARTVVPSGPSRCTAGNQWLSVSTSATDGL